MNLNRRDLIKLGVSASGVLVLPLQFPKKALADKDKFTPPEWKEFTESLTIPPILQPYERKVNVKIENNKVIENNALDLYQIVMCQGEKTFTKYDKNADGTPRTTKFWGYNGMFPGPTIHQKLDREAKVDFVNKLGKTNIGNKKNEPLPNEEDIKPVIHLHGMASLPQYDGFAEDYICPDHYKEYIYPNDRPASFWYHDHELHRTTRNVAMGLAGMWIVQDDELECPLNLPQKEFDVPLIFQTPPYTWDDSRPKEQKEKVPTPTLINGFYEPLMKVGKRNYRFRLLNATATQIYNLELVSYNPDEKEEEKKFVDEVITVIGTDSGLRDMPLQTRSLDFVMAERYEILIDFKRYKPNNKIALVHRKRDEKDKTKITEEIPLLCFEVVHGDVQDTCVPPSKLSPYRDVDSKIVDAPPNFVFVFNSNGKKECASNGYNAQSINGRVWATNDIQAYPEFGIWQKWRLINLSQAPHPIHIHLIDFQIIRRSDLNGNVLEIPPYEKSWKDVFYLRPRETLDIVTKFGPHLGRYMLHCHNLLHEDCDMMTQFEVVIPANLRIKIDEFNKKADELKEEKLKTQKIDESLEKGPEAFDNLLKVLDEYTKAVKELVEYLDKHPELTRFIVEKNDELELQVPSPLSAPAKPLPKDYHTYYPNYVKYIDECSRSKR